MLTRLADTRPASPSREYASVKHLLVILILSALIAGCAPGPEPKYTVIIGATYTASGAEPLEHSIVVVKDGLINAVGRQQDVPVPAGSEKVDGTGLVVKHPEDKPLRPGDPANLNLIRNDSQAGAVVERQMRGGHWVNV